MIERGDDAIDIAIFAFHFSTLVDARWLFCNIVKEDGYHARSYRTNV